MKKIFSILLTLVLALSLCLVTAVPVAAETDGTPIIDGKLGVDEWGTPLCTTAGTAQSITVYTYVTVDALYLAFDTGDEIDNRGGSGLDVLDWNVGLVGSDFAPPASYPWRYVLVSKVSPDNSWEEFYSEIDGYYGSWGDTWSISEIDQYYSTIPAGIEMVTSFTTGHRVTEFKVPMSLMFDGAHGWDGPSAGDVLLLGGTFSGEDAGGNYEMLWWPTGIDHGNADTYAKVLVQGNTDVVTTAQLDQITAINVEPTSIDFGSLTPGEAVSGDDIYVTNIGTVIVDVTAALADSGTVFEYLSLDGTLPISNWRIEDLAGGTTADPVKTLLDVPRAYSAKGVEENTLIFTVRTY